MKAYADTSIIVSALTDEIHSQVADDWLTARAAGELTLSWWCITESASAIAAKAREGVIGADDLRQVVRTMREQFVSSAQMIEVQRKHYDIAADLMIRSTRLLYAGDALHLAIAHDYGITLWALDHRMIDAAEALGLDARLLA